LKDTMQMPKGRRTNIEIAADILRLLRLGQTDRIEIASIVQISREQAARYLQKLKEAGALEEAEQEIGLPSYRITPKGLSIIGSIEQMREILPSSSTLDILKRSKIQQTNVGQVLVTGSVADLAGGKKEFASFVRKSLERYRRGDWGDMSAADQQLNQTGLARNLRLFASYESPGLPEIWITTEPDRSSSTIMFPEEDISLTPLEHYELVARTATELEKTD
jgi:predicted transcriptional regulator